MAARTMATVYAFPVRPKAQQPGVWARLVDAVNRRRTHRMLAEMDDRMLSDIGMNRGISRTGDRANWPAWDVSSRGW